MTSIIGTLLPSVSEQILRAVAELRDSINLLIAYYCISIEIVIGGLILKYCQR